MKTNFSTNASWNGAAISGLVMALATIAASFIQGLTGKIGGVAGGFISFIAEFAKIAFCIYVFRWLLIKFHSQFSDVTLDRLKNYGLKIALFSAIIVSAYSLVSILYISPETYKEAIEVTMQQYSSMLDSNSMSKMDEMIQKIPTYTFFVSLIYCFIWGWVLTSIFSKSIVPDDPFMDCTGEKDEDGNQEEHYNDNI